ncbi:hypothetical protein CKM354_000972300 [Cercospora kikuchii]|uniref:Heterokaryon incompatibility domain-containing protein n=1 Tax=Cercospora kikuchii TaxID=84275 RepID=A0A9P3CY27_9PEZI|nr:uncharacterized protein CKM354_000972300 [Cercospora kikuchii]GIZ46603.1 hypothetical protein CKM354_000972300 [Cercospora kikuchii]
MARHQQYQSSYPPLHENDIRTLLLQPGLTGQPLSGSLQLARLGTSANTEQDYEALSYVCGPPVYDHTINLPEGPLQITANLHSALDSLRLQNEVRTLWCDAICIDQTSDDERATQVAMMGQIYKSARRVLAWLGLAEPGDALAFATIAARRELSKRRKGSNAEYANVIPEWLVSHPYCECCKMAFSLPEAPATEGLLRVIDILKRAYFSRIWTIQEPASGQVVEVFCSPHHASWEDFEYTVRHAHLLGDRQADESEGEPLLMSEVRDFKTGVEDFRILDTYRSEESRNSLVPSRLLEAIVGFSTRQCYDPRDRIYAIRGIEGMEAAGELLPNYSISILELYREVALRCVLGSRDQEEYSPNISLVLALSGTESADVNKLGWPSWTPHFHHLTERSRIKAFDYSSTTGSQFLHSNRDFSRAATTAATGELCMQGTLFTVIEEVLECTACPRVYKNDSHTEEYWTETLDSLLHWYCRCRCFVQRCWTFIAGEQDIDEFMERLFRCNTYLHEQNYPISLDDFQNLTEDFDLDQHDELPESLRVEECYKSLFPYLHSKPQPHLDRWRILCRTARGQIGWVPPSCRAKDVVAVFPGAPNAFALRRIDHQRWEQLGDTYIDGLRGFEDDIDVMRKVSFILV